MTDRGCVEDKSTECNALPQSFWEEKGGVCVSMQACEATHKDCRNCMKINYYDNVARPDTDWHCIDCMNGTKPVSGHCVKD
jgi:hypothetical protein